ncbi:mavicyanin [Cajanus cajan]|uniref:Stellacyanin n=1 Tax=Cajanus cajan TaxID=3821 RepID=A0A151SLN8_CAJCA|nr:mavicyanin [Cajanus cajan]KYP55717.1 Stellacyanin [Cajanus cajan]
MATKINVAILFVLVAVALTMPHSTEATEHVVGGGAGWIISPEGASFYSSFAANTTFRLNDTLVFNFKTGSHNVVTVSKKSFETCNVSEAMESFNTGPARISLNRTGEFYFACSFPHHCMLGQKLSIDVTAASSSLAPASSLSASRPTMPVAVTVTLLLMTLSINVLF